MCLDSLFPLWNGRFEVGFGFPAIADKPSKNGQNCDFLDLETHNIYASGSFFDLLTYVLHISMLFRNLQEKMGVYVLVLALLAAESAAIRFYCSACIVIIGPIMYSAGDAAGIACPQLGGILTLCFGVLLRRS